MDPRQEKNCDRLPTPFFSTLEVLQQQLKTAQENEKNAKAETKNVIDKLITVQTKLDETTADFEILKNEQHQLAV